MGCFFFGIALKVVRGIDYWRVCAKVTASLQIMIQDISKSYGYR